MCCPTPALARFPHAPALSLLWPHTLSHRLLLRRRLRNQGLKFGLWTIRGVHKDAVASKLPVKGMEQYTVDQLVDFDPVGGGANGSCLWASEWLGVNASHPAAQAYVEESL